MATDEGCASRAAASSASCGAPRRVSCRTSAACIAARSREARATRSIVWRHADGSAGLPAKREATRPKSRVYSLARGRIHGKRRGSIASRTAPVGANGSVGLGTKSIYYRRDVLRFPVSQGARPLPYDDASGVSPPSAFGTYRVLHQIGSGVLGPVFRAYDSQLDRLVAIKTVKIDLVPEDASRLADGLRALAASTAAHPAIVGAVDAGLEGATPFIALEYASGESLDVILRQSGAWPVARALPVLREIAAAIDASWVASVGHGALHPRDIFVEVGLTDVRVTGFGIGQALEAVGAKGPLRRPYSAPERGDGTPWDIRADVYSLGVVAFEMLSGHRPVGTEDETETLAAQPFEGLDVSPDARAAVRRVLAVAMAELPGDRHETATGLVEALAGAAQSSAVAAEATVEAPAPSHEPPKRAARIKRPRPIALDLPLLDAADPMTDGSPDLQAADGAPDLQVQSAEPEPLAEPVVNARPEPDPEPAPEPRFRDVPRGPEAPARPIPHVDFDRSVVSDGADAEVGPAVAAFPWVAVLAVFTAGLVLGGVVMYQMGWKRGSAAATQTAAASALAAAQAIQTPAVELPPATAPLPVTSPPASPPASISAAPRRSPAPEAAAAGRLVIQSVPAGALVTIDGRRVGETPISVPVALGRHEVQVARPGYVPHVERVELTKKSASRTLRVQLKPGGGTAPEADAATRTAGRQQARGVNR